MKNLTGKTDIKISIDVLNGLSPQRNMSNAKKEDIIDQTFVLHSLVTADPSLPKKLDKMDTETTPRIKVKYVNKATAQSFLLPIRSLLNLEVASTVTKDGDNDEYDATADEAKKRVHEHLIAELEDSKSISLLPCG